MPIQKNYNLGIYEKAIPSQLSWPERLRSAKTAGFDYLEISVDETNERLARLDWTESKRREIWRETRDSNMPIRSMCLSGHRKYPLGSRDESVRERSLDIFSKAAVLACDLGIRIIQLAGYDVYYEESTQSSRAWFLENLNKCVDIASRMGVMLGFETMETPFMDTVGKAMEYVKKVNSQYLGVYPDIGNLTNAATIYNTDILDDIETGKGHLIAMHLKETIPGKYRDMRFGTGHVDFAPGINKARMLGVNSFVAECWDDGSLDWEKNLCEVNRFIRLAIAGE